jgi:hypothetical protein
MVLSYISSMMVYSCPAFVSVARYHIKNLQVLQSQCFHIATIAICYTANMQIHDELWVPYFFGRIRSVTVILSSKLADLENQLFELLGRHL